MDLKERLQMIMEKEFGISTGEQLNEAYEKLDLSVYGIFTRKGEENETGDIGTFNNRYGIVRAV